MTTFDNKDPYRALRCQKNIQKNKKNNYKSQKQESK